MKLGLKKVITAEDLYEVLPEDESEKLGKQLEMLFVLTYFFSYFINY